jgi:hypothetical protein
MQYRDEFADRIDRDPQPQDVRPTAQPRAQFVEKDVRQVEVLLTRSCSVALWETARVREVVMVA